jgi:predicted GTPase
VDARPYAAGTNADTFREFKHLTGEVPAMGYSPQQVRDLEATLRAVPAEAVIDATPVNLSRLIKLDKPIVDVRYEFRERGNLLPGILEKFEHEKLRAGAGASSRRT